MLLLFEISELNKTLHRSTYAIVLLLACIDEITIYSVGKKEDLDIPEFF
jgi:hypothetical protein